MNEKSTTIDNTPYMVDLDKGEIREHPLGYQCHKCGYWRGYNAKLSESKVWWGDCTKHTDSDLTSHAEIEIEPSEFWEHIQSADFVTKWNFHCACFVEIDIVEMEAKGDKQS